MIKSSLQLLKARRTCDITFSIRAYSSVAEGAAKDERVVYLDKSQHGLSQLVMNTLGLSDSNTKVKKPLWDQLVGECALHLHSSEFREEFYGLIRNDEIYIRLYSLHLFLLAERLKACHVPMRESVSDFYELRKVLYVLSARRFPLTFYQKSYQNFHDHLPEELFITDFRTFLTAANKKTYKNYSKVFSQLDDSDESTELL